MFKNMKLGSKIATGFAAVCLITVLLGGIALWGMRSLMKDLNEIGGNSLPSVRSLLIMSESMYKVVVAERGLINSRMMEPRFRQAQYDFAEKALKNADAAWKVYDALPRDKENATAWTEFVPKWETWKKSHQPVVLGSQEKDRLLSSGVGVDDPRMAALDDTIYQASLESRRNFLEIQEPLAKMVELNINLAGEASKYAELEASRTRAMTMAAIALAILLAAGLGFYLKRDIADILKGLLDESERLSEAAVNGQLATRADSQRINFEFRCVLEGMNRTLDAVIAPLNVAGEYVDRISKGNIPPKITDDYRGDFAEIKLNLNTCIDAVSALVADTKMLSAAAVEGKLATRANASRHHGDFRLVVEGVNQMLDAVIGPLNVAAEYVDRISKGDLPALIADDYHGDFNELKINLNVLISAMNTVSEVAEKIARGNLMVDVRPRSAQDRLMLSLKQMVAHLQGLADSAEAIAAGDLTVTVKPASGEDVIGNAFVAMVDNLRLIVGNVSSGAQSIASATDQIAAGSAEMAQRTEEQAASLEETAASMEELTSTVKQNADNSQQANQLAIAASDVAVKGGAVIGKVVTTMDSISDSSKKISNIIGVIDGIAFQTNILALNAAVEAARAGEQGRGFAVVAGEVRNLAQRSAATAKEIKALIDDSVDKVESGGKLVDEAGRTMQEIVASIRQVTEIVSEISAASSEQSSGIEQVNIAVTNMDQMTQQNSSIVQQASGAAEALQEQAQMLVEAVGRFRLDDTDRALLRPQRGESPQPVSFSMERQGAFSRKAQKGSGLAYVANANGYWKSPGPGKTQRVISMAIGDVIQWKGFSD